MLQKTIFLSILIVFSLFLTGCSEQNINSSKNLLNSSITSQKTTSSKESFQVKYFTSLTPEQFKKLLGKPNIVLLDVRTPQEFMQGHLSGAINIDIYNPNFIEEIKKLDKTKHYLIYCRSGNRTKTAIKIMKQLGFKKVNDLNGGIKNRIKYGYPVVK